MLQHAALLPPLYQKNTCARVLELLEREEQVCCVRYLLAIRYVDLDELCNLVVEIELVLPLSDGFWSHRVLSWWLWPYEPSWAPWDALLGY